LWIEDNPVKIIILTGIFIRVLIAILYQHITMYPDSTGYVNLAERILSFDFVGYEGERSPGYPLLLAVTNISYLFTVILQSALGIASLVLVYKTALITSINKKLAFFPSLGLSCYIPMVFFEFAILSETLTLFTITVIFYLYFSICAGKSENFYNWLLIIACSFLVLIKPFYIFLPVLLFVFLFFNRITKRDVLFKYICIIPITLFLGWSYINKVNTGHFTSTTFYGFNLAQNCVSFAEKTTPEYAETGRIYAKYRDEISPDKEIAMTIWEAEPELREKTGLSFPDLSAKLYDYSIATIKENPGDYLKQIFISWCGFWKTSLYWEYNSVAIPHANDVILYVCYAERIILQLIKILFMLLIPYNIIRTVKEKKLSPSLIISGIVLTASILQALITYGTNSRFSFPFELLITLSVVANWVSFWKRSGLPNPSKGGA
jgi:4-amino-4-deoxy-L-arabinose transferase-like glycosyltransferase